MESFTSIGDTIIKRCTWGVTLKLEGPRNGWVMNDKTYRQKR